MKKFNKGMVVLSLAAILGACASPSLPPSELRSGILDESGQYVYRIGTGDVLSVFVWGNEDVTGDYPVRPDGKISMALSGNLEAAGKTTQQLEDKLAEDLSEYIKNPEITVMVKSASGNMLERIKVVGDAVNPASLPYRHGMTVMDLMISVGGLSPYANGNRAILLRFVDGELKEYSLRLEDLMEDADLSANVDLKPGDVVRIPEAWF
jgi:polysaccharide export outer membrane protein